MRQEYRTWPSPSSNQITQLLCPRFDPINLMDFFHEWIRANAVGLPRLEDRLHTNSLGQADQSKLKGAIKLLKSVKFETRHGDGKHKFRRYTFSKLSSQSSINFMFNEPPQSVAVRKFYECKRDISDRSLGLFPCQIFDVPALSACSLCLSGRHRCSYSTRTLLDSPRSDGW